MKTFDLANEWSLLQNQFDSYEKYSLLIKLASIGLLSAAYFTDHLGVVVLFLLLILWMQDAIWKTFQSRIETHLLQLESDLASAHELESKASNAYQFNSLYLKNRPTAVGLISEYLHQAVRPTIAFPHAFLLLMLGFNLIN